MTAPLELVVSPGDVLPPYEQIRRQLEGLIRAGILPPGRRLPALRQLAGDLGLAVGTVGRAYKELEAAGLIATRRAAGTRVADPVPPLPDIPASDRAAAVDRLAREFAGQARALGAAPAECLQALERAFCSPC